MSNARRGPRGRHLSRSLMSALYATMTSLAPRPTTIHTTPARPTFRYRAPDHARINAAGAKRARRRDRNIREAAHRREGQEAAEMRIGEVTPF